jgi:tryptophan-rich sensory protein
MPKRILLIAGNIGACEAAGAVGSVFTGASLPTWYRKLKKPSFQPPGWVFGPVWTILYALMGTAASIIESKKKPDNRPSLLAFCAQLLLNVLWTYLFFGRRSPLAGCIELIALWAAIALTIALFWKLSKPAALLLAPYLLWVTFAAALNLSIWRLNRK